MPKFRRERVDDNQAQIVKQLRKIPGVTVKTGVDDILVGYRNFNYFFEVKNPDRVLKKKGGLKAGALKDSQIDLMNTWSGHYSVVWTLDQILKEIGVERN